MSSFPPIGTSFIPLPPPQAFIPQLPVPMGYAQMYMNYLVNPPLPLLICYFLIFSAGRSVAQEPYICGSGHSILMLAMRDSHALTCLPLTCLYSHSLEEEFGLLHFQHFMRFDGLEYLVWT